MTVKELKLKLEDYMEDAEVMMEFRYKMGSDTGDTYHSSIGKLRTSAALGGAPYVLLYVKDSLLAGGW